MTVQPTRDRLRAHLRRLIAAWEGPGNPSVSVADLAHLLDQLDAAERRADEARAERDHFHEVAATFRDKFNAAESHPLTPDAITDEMVERARKRGSELVGALWDPEVVEAMLTAALTPDHFPGKTRYVTPWTKEEA